ncbi:helix-turn-helix domain-containing protein [Dokdonia ponticola]|uniref:Helix-turn-helix domain-containing protein n=1 Tax=Dokdonia ponticola TaxID=2041041 RepID=A0ABV9I104_9FLAO
MVTPLKTIKWFSKIICFLCISNVCVAQKSNDFKIPDSLADKSYTYLFGQFRKNYTDTITSLLYLKTSLAKATKEDDKLKKAITLNTLSAYEEDKVEKIALIKQAVLESEGLENIELIPVYTNVGGIYHDYYEYASALTYYLKALELSEKFNIEEYRYIILTDIAKVKEGIGKHDEALTLYRKCLNYGNTKYPNDTIRRITNVINIAESLRNNKKYDSASYYYNTIVNIAYQKLPSYGRILSINEGINQYYQKKYLDAEKLLTKGASKLEMNPESQTYYIVSQIYQGKLQQLQYNNKEKAKAYYLKVDSIQTATGLIIPEISTAYDFLISYYKDKGDFKKQLDITNKFLKLKTVISSRHIQTTDRLYAEFDTPQLLKNKQALINKLENKTNTTTIYLGLLILGFLFLFIMQYTRYKKHKKRYNTIISNLNKKEKETPVIEDKITPTPVQKLNIDEAVITSVLKKLKTFETKKEFLQTDINISILAKKCNTNTKYLSKIINIHKGKSFINYINDHRIDYILKELKENSTLQLYTIKSISEEAGFNTAESFATAFKKKTGIKPSYYIRNLKNEPII